MRSCSQTNSFARVINHEDTESVCETTKAVPDEVLPMKARPHQCTESSCSKTYRRRGDLTRHIKETHHIGGRLRCPIKYCAATRPGDGFKRMHRLVEHLMKDLRREAHCKPPHPQLFNQADATWLAHDFNAPTRDLQEIVFAADGTGIRTEAEVATMVYRSRAPEKYFSLYFRVLCSITGCTFSAVLRCASQLSFIRQYQLDNDLRSATISTHLQISHGHPADEANDAKAKIYARAQEYAKSNPSVTWL